MKKKKEKAAAPIALNRRARHDYLIEETFEAGVVLQGWEVKSIRAGKVNLTHSYVYIKEAEAWLVGAVITPLTSASTHVNTNQQRTRKLLLNKRELSKLIGAVERRGYTVVPLKMYWKKHLVKIEIALAKGKHLHDKRASDKEKEWKRDKARILKQSYN